MPRTNLWLPCIAVALACGPDLHYETLAEDAEAYCHQLAFCEMVPDPEKYAAKCENSRADDSEDALEEGKKCANTFAGLVHCLGGLSCEELSDWISGSGAADRSLDFPCKAERSRFLDECEDTWFAPNAQR